MGQVRRQLSVAGRREVVEAVRGGLSLAEAGRRFDVSPTTIRRWRARYDPARPHASLRPTRRGPRGPRPGREPIRSMVKFAVAAHPEWGRRRIQRYLAERRMEVPESTIERWRADIRRDAALAARAPAPAAPELDRASRIIAQWRASPSAFPRRHKV